MKPDKGLAYLTIGDLARRAACRVETVRYYEHAGLMPVVCRVQGWQKM